MVQIFSKASAWAGSAMLVDGDDGSSGAVVEGVEGGCDLGLEVDSPFLEVVGGVLPAATGVSLSTMDVEVTPVGGGCWSFLGRIRGGPVGDALRLIDGGGAPCRPSRVAGT